MTEANLGTTNLGTVLRSAREDREISLESIADRLKIRPSLIAALEAGRFSEMPEAIYTRAYVQRYAQIVGLEPGPLVQAYDRLSGFRNGEAVVIPKAPPARQAGLRVPPLAFVALGVLLAAGGFWLWRTQTGSSRATSANTTPRIAPGAMTRPGNNTLNAPSQGDPSVLLTFKLSVDSTPSGAAVFVDRYKKGVTPLKDAPISGGRKRELRIEKPGYTPFVQIIELTQNRNLSVALAKAPVTAVPQTPVQASGESTITLRFQGKSWIRVTDETGKLLFQGIPEVGSSQTFPSPITVRAGRPDVISAVVNGTTRSALGDANAATIKLP